MKTDFKFSNLLGSSFLNGNLVFSADTLYSSLGNRFTLFDLKNSKSHTLCLEARRNIYSFDVHANLLLSIDVHGHLILVNLHKQSILSTLQFKGKGIIKFSPNGLLFAVSINKKLQVWRVPTQRGYHPFEMVKEFAPHYDTINSISWSHDSQFIASASKDMTARLQSLDHSFLLTGHHDSVLSVYFSLDDQSIFTISRDGSLHLYENLYSPLVPLVSQVPQISQVSQISQVPRKRNKFTEKVKESRVGEEKRVEKWKSSARYYFNQNNAKVVSASFHPKSGLLSVGFDSGVFGIWELPDFVNIQTLSMSQNKIDTIAVNGTGEWIAFGSCKLGQLLVWEWQSETYVIKQQGHHNEMRCLDYSLDGQYIATGGHDCKVKVWSTQTGFCFVTFSEHTAPINAIEFAQKKQIVFSASADGTVRAYDLIRYRNFRTFTSPTPQQFSSLAIDASAEIVVAASVDNYEIYMWSIQTSKLLQIFSGHQGPVSCLSFSPTTSQLISGSWDKTIRLWEVFSRDQGCETIDHPTEILALAISPNGEVLASTTLDGNINLWSMDTAREIGGIEGRHDITGGRSSKDMMSLANSASGKNFTSICFTSDGQGVLAGGNSKYVCLYDIKSKALLKRYQISANLSLDRMTESLNSKRMTEAGPIDQIDVDAELSDLEDRIDRSLPGVQRGDLSMRKYQPEARTFSIRFSPTGRQWAAVSTQGLLIYSVDETLNFDPFDLNLDITPESIGGYVMLKEYTKALIASFRLGEVDVIDRVYHTIPSDFIPLILRSIGSKYFTKFLEMLLRQFNTNPRIEFHLTWTATFLRLYADRLSGVRPLLVGLRKCVVAVDSVLQVGAGNRYSIDVFKAFGRCDIKDDDVQMGLGI